MFSPFSPHLTDPNIIHSTKDWRVGGDSRMPGFSVFKYTGGHRCNRPTTSSYPEVSYGFLNLYLSHPTHFFN